MSKTTIRFRYQDVYKNIKVQTKNFGADPVKDVGQIMLMVQNYPIPEKKVMGIIQKIYIDLFLEKGRGDVNQARQSWASASGNNFEAYVRNLINSVLNKEGILAVKGDQLKNLPKTKDIVEFLTLRANRRCVQKRTGVWPDSDIVVLSRDRQGVPKVFALLNCKTSDHSRNDAVLFWALALRDTGIKYCLVTQDLDNKFVKGDNDASSLRKKCEAYLDRVYTIHPQTIECSQIRKIDFFTSDGSASLFNDLRNWRKDIIPYFSGQPISTQDIL
jgi:hypothetical protein